MERIKHPRHLRPLPRLAPLAAALFALSLFSFGAGAAPQGAVVKAGAATVTQSGATTRIEQQSERAVIDWRSFGIDAAESVLFSQPSRASATLNRVTGPQMSMILGRLDANGQVVLVNSNGIVFGAGSRVNVGSLIASTANVNNADFMAGRMNFVEPGRPGAGVDNRGTLTAAEGGLIALVAPHVSNSGLIQAHLGKVVLGAGDTFTIDLYGDGLINLALAPGDAPLMLDETGKPLGSLVSQAGRIEADGGQVVLINAPTAKAVLDQIINLSGSIQANAVAQHQGRIVLLGHGGTIDVSGTLGALGTRAGESGGTIEIIGEKVHLGGAARVSASGSNGGGTIHIGGPFEGKGSTYRARTTNVDAGARLEADAIRSGDGGEVVVWADGHAAHAGEISARGGATGGNGGRVEVSGKNSLNFAGLVDAGAVAGTAGSLLLDPAFLDIGMIEAAVISQILRNGTSTTLTADYDIKVNSVIDGRNGAPGGGLALTAGRDIALNRSIVTNGGAITISAGGKVLSAMDTGLFSGGGAINVNGAVGLRAGNAVADGGAITLGSSSGDISLEGDIVTNGAGNVTATATSGTIIAAAGKGIYAGNGRVVLEGAHLLGGLVSTRGGPVTLGAGKGQMTLGDVISTQGGSVSASSAGLLTIASGKGIFTGSGTIDLTGGAIAADGPLVTTGATRLTSTTTDVTLNHAIGPFNGALSIHATNGGVFIQAPIQNLFSGADVFVAAAGRIVVSSQIGGLIDGQPGAPGGTVTMTSSTGAIDVNAFVVTQNGRIDISAEETVTMLPNVGLFSNGGNIFVSAGHALSVADMYSSGGTATLTSGGNISLLGDIVAGAGAVVIESTGGSVSASEGSLTRGDAGVTVTAPPGMNLLPTTDPGVPTPSTNPPGQAGVVPDLPEIVIDPPVAPSNGVSRAGLADATARAMLEANTASRVIAAETEQPAGAQPQILRNEPQPLLVFSGGRGYARMAELGLGGSIGNLLDVFLVPLPTEGEDGRRGEQD